MILIIDDDIAVQTSIGLLLKQSGFSYLSAKDPDSALNLMKQNKFELILLDMNFSIDTSGEEGIQLFKRIKSIDPFVPVILITAWGTISLAVEGMKLGASDFINKPWSNEHLLQSIKTTLHLSSKNHPSETSRIKLDDNYNLEGIIGEHPEFLKILETACRISNTEASVLITGESGTGKELIAEVIHNNSERKQKKFVKVNLGGISSTLFESEMFGHKKGSFTDAKENRKGRFEAAHKGTIFLDEIGDLDLNSQVKMLRVLQDRSFEVLGSNETKNVDVRIVSATNKNLEMMILKNEFREDLFYRINLITLKMPALRERSSDIPLLVNRFIENLKTIYQKENLRISNSALQWLSELSWPGNVRELKNLVERTVLVSEKNLLEIEDFKIHLNSDSLKAKGNLPAVGTMTLEQIEESMIRKAIEFHKGNISQVAKSLGLSRGALYRRMEKYGIIE